MFNQFLSSANYLAIAVSGLTYWILGAIWFSAIFGNMWGTELEKHGVKIQQPTKQQMMTKLIQTFVLNVIVAFGVAFIVFLTNSTAVFSAIKIGLLTGVCFSAATIGIAYTWEGKSLKLLFIDCGYPILGITACTIILSLWK